MQAMHSKLLLPGSGQQPQSFMYRRILAAPRRMKFDNHKEGYYDYAPDETADTRRPDPFPAAYGGLRSAPYCVQALSLIHI